jgi:hypothetical protein
MTLTCSRFECTVISWPRIIRSRRRPGVAWRARGGDGGRTEPAAGVWQQCLGGSETGVGERGAWGDRYRRRTAVRGRTGPKITVSAAARSASQNIQVATVASGPGRFLARG